MYKWRFPFRLGSIFIVVAAKVPYIYYHEELEDARLSLGYRIILVAYPVDVLRGSFITHWGGWGTNARRTNP